ncbi:MAG: hypothetical protein ABWZ40_14490 [Caulobacterales bacterium]
MARHIFIALTHPAPGREADFVEWQKKVHIPDGLNVPGYLAATFYKLSDTQLLDGKPDGAGAYATVWEIESDDLEKTKAAIGEMLGAFTWSDAIDDARTRTVTYTAATPRLTREENRKR